jgi:hypothetical protein
MHGSTVIVELESNPEHIVTLPLEESRHDRGVDAARHRDHDACLGRVLG